VPFLPHSCRHFLLQRVRLGEMLGPTRTPARRYR
jgi:hypothetical protein